jgi:hypothetical protein
VDLGFRHRVPVTKSTGGGSTGPGFRPDSGFTPFTPGGGNIPQGDIPGIPNNIQRYVPPQPPPQQLQQQQQPQGPQRRPTPNKDDPNDDGDGKN